MTIMPWLYIFTNIKINRTNNSVVTVRKMGDIEMPLNKLKITNTSSRKDIKKKYYEWIPFNVTH